jgi:hypothetical protein
MMLILLFSYYVIHGITVASERLFSQPWDKITLKPNVMLSLETEMAKSLTEHVPSRELHAWELLTVELSCYAPKRFIRCRANPL